MKYIKKFENKKKNDIIVGDHVKYIKNQTPEHFDELSIYTVTKIDTWAIKYKYFIERELPGPYQYRWAARSELLLIPEYEINANKYNL